MVIPGHKYKIRKWKKRPGFWNSDGHMDMWQGQIVTIHSVKSSRWIKIEEDCHEWVWREVDFVDTEILPNELFEI